MRIVRAVEADVDEVLELQAANQPDRGGSLSAALPRSRIVEMMRTMPTVVARKDGRVVGFLISSTRESNAGIGIVQAMLAAYPGAADCYIYGPVCVAAEERGRGLAGRMFEELLRLLPGREGVLFIRRDNASSIRAHARMGMREVAGFHHANHDYAVLAYGSAAEHGGPQRT